MTTSISSPADAVNAALVRIGHKRQIGSLRDGSEEAQLGIAIYGQTRDDLLRDGSWGFAQREIALTLLKSAPAGGYIPGFSPWDPTTNPPVAWRFEYGYPDDCLKLRGVRPTPIFVPNFDPGPYTSSIANDNYFTPPRRVILTNLENAIGMYTGRITDLSTMAVDFVEALIEALGERLATALSSPQIAQVEAAEGRVDKTMAEMEQG